MSPEQEPRQYNFPWQYDTEHFLGIKTEFGDLQMRPSTTELYLYPDDPEIDHIYIVKELKDDGTSLGYRIFREHCDRIGPGAFGALVDQLIEHGFDIADDDEEPQDSDINAWEQAFNRKYERPNPIDKIVKLAMKNWDAGMQYYLEEWKDYGDNKI